MENQDFPPQNNFEKAGGKRRPLKWVGWVLAGLIILGAAFWLWRGYLSPAARSERETRKNYEKYLAWEKNYTEAMKADTYGGKTPEETLKMFIEALEKGDIELASKYFVLDKDGKIDQKWVDLLMNIKINNNLNRFADDLKNYNESKKTFDPYFVFLYYNNDRSLALQLVMVLNQYSNLWKIESF